MRKGTTGGRKLARRIATGSGGYTYRNAAGRFISREAWAELLAEERARAKLNAQAREERIAAAVLPKRDKRSGKFTPTKAVNAQGKRIRGVRGNLGGVLPRTFGSAKAQQRADSFLESALRSELPPPDYFYLEADAADPARSVWVQGWRVEGLHNLPAARGILTTMKDRLRRTKEMVLTRFAGFTGWGKEGDSFGSAWRHPSNTLSYLDGILHRESSKEILNKARIEGQAVSFEVEAMSRQPLFPVPGGKRATKGALKSTTKQKSTTKSTTKGAKHGRGNQKGTAGGSGRRPARGGGAGVQRPAKAAPGRRAGARDAVGSVRGKRGKVGVGAALSVNRGASKQRAPAGSGSRQRPKGPGKPGRGKAAARSKP